MTCDRAGSIPPPPSEGFGAISESNLGPRICDAVFCFLFPHFAMIETAAGDERHLWRFGNTMGRGNPVLFTGAFSGGARNADPGS